MTTEPADRPPEGFTPLRNRGSGEGTAGPFYIRQCAAGEGGDGGAWQLGFRVTAAKLNPAGVCHGGILATFADVQGSAVKRGLGLTGWSPTVNLSLDYVAPAPEGAWVQSTPELVRRTRSLLFVQAVLRADGDPCLRVSAIYKLGGQQGDA